VKLVTFLIWLQPLLCIAAEPLFPAAEGTTWNYEMIQERLGPDFNLSEPTQKDRFAVSYRIAGTQQLENLDFVKMEMDREGVRASTDLIRQEENGIVCAARLDAKGALVRFYPPQTMVMTPLKTGTKWKFEGKIGETKVSQYYEISGEEDVEVPAGKFRAWHVHCDQTAPTSATIDRWFVLGTGFVKIETQVSSPAGAMLERTALALKEPPKVGVKTETKPEAKPAQGESNLIVGVSKEPKGELTATFNAAAPAIYARWQGRGLPGKAAIHAVFIAENVAGVAADYEIDDADAVTPSPNAHGVFTLTQPEGGWTPGDYRVEFFVNDEPAGTAKFKITK